MDRAHIFLVGMMGSGKSTVGRMLAAELAVPFLDLDTEIEARTGRTIAELFSQKGEFEFRTCEAQILRELPWRHPRSVIATGGGAPVHFGSMAFMIATGTCVYLRVPAEELLRRLSAERAERPLLAAPHWEETVEVLLAKRESVYQTADIVHSSTQETPAETLERLMGRL